MSEASPLWNEIISKSGWSLDNFRSPGEINSRFAAWEPRELSLRWYRSFLNLAFFSASDSVKNAYAEHARYLNLGNPVTNVVLYRGKRFSINLDYLMAFEDVEFIATVQVSEIRSVCEVGAGFGRLAHLLLLSRDEIESYVIIDLPQVLSLSQEYLRTVLPRRHFEKIEFILPSQIPQELRQPGVVDLAIQVDGLQEMTTDSLEEYFSIFQSSLRFYSKNVIAKYLPLHAGLDIPDSGVPLSLGRSLEVCDIWNTGDLESYHLKHIDYYRPKLHGVEISSLDRLFPHYCNVLYKSLDPAPE